MRHRLLIVVLTLSMGNILFAQEPKLMLPIGHTSKTIRASFFHDGKYIITSGFAENEIKIWDTKSGILLTILGGLASRVVSFDSSPDGKKIVTASDDGTAKIWDPFSGKILATILNKKNLPSLPPISVPTEKIF